MASSNPGVVNIHGSRLQLTPRGLKANGRYLPQFDTGGTTFYVSSVTGTANGSGLSPDEAISTLDTAVGRCTANKGDTIVVLPGHTETITAASAIDFDVAGINVIGVGNGSLMPTIVFNHANATVAVGADNIYLHNLRFNSSITAVTVGLNVEADVDYTHVDGCLFDVDLTGTDEFNHSIRFVDGNVGGLVENCVFRQGLGGAVAAIHLDADTNYLRILNNYIDGDYSTACIAGDTTLSTNLLIQGNNLFNGVGGNIGTEPAIELLTGTTGVVSDNYIVCNLATKLASIVGDTVFLFQNYYNEDVAATGGIIGTASADD